MYTDYSKPLGNVLMESDTPYSTVLVGGWREVGEAECRSLSMKESHEGGASAPYGDQSVVRGLRDVNNNKGRLSRQKRGEALMFARKRRPQPVYLD